MQLNKLSVIHPSILALLFGLQSHNDFTDVGHHFGGAMNVFTDHKIYDHIERSGGYAKVAHEDIGNVACPC